MAEMTTGYDTFKPGEKVYEAPIAFGRGSDGEVRYQRLRPHIVRTCSPTGQRITFEDGHSIRRGSEWRGTVLRATPELDQQHLTEQEQRKQEQAQQEERKAWRDSPPQRLRQKLIYHLENTEDMPFEALKAAADVLGIPEA